MSYQCAWCQNNISLQLDQHFQANLKTHFICTECLIPLLPRTLNVHKEEFLSGHEKRGASRFPLISKVYISSKIYKRKATNALILDMSTLGMKIQLDLPLKFNDTFTLGFIGRELVYKAKGLIVHVMEVPESDPPLYEMGIQLHEINQILRESHSKLEKLEEADQPTIILLSVNETKPDQLLAIGILLMRKNKFVEALAYFEKWMSLFSRNIIPSVLRNLAWCYYNIQNYKNAHLYYSSAKEGYLKVPKEYEDEFHERRIKDCQNRINKISKLVS